MNEKFCQVVRRCSGLSVAHTYDAPQERWVACCRLHLDMIERMRNARPAR